MNFYLLHRYMEILKAISIIGLLTIALYFIMVNLWDNKAIPTGNRFDQIGQVGQVDQHLISNKIKPDTLCDNTLDVIPTGSPPSWIDRNLSGTPFHAEQGTAIPAESNHDIYEKTADFGSDVTNINQFYKNNPELFNRITNTLTPEWDLKQFDNAHSKPVENIEGYNFEKNFTKL